MRFWITTATTLAAAAPACAQEIAIKPMIEARARYEHLDQADFATAADAVTIRVRAGAEVTRGRWVALGEAQGNLAVVGTYYDGLHGPANRPTIGDPENVAIYRAQLQYRSAPLTVTAGRQRIALDDERFVGGAQIRNNAQTFDAVRTEIVPVKGLKLDVTYAWDVRTIWGSDGRGPRQRGVGGHNVFANAGAATPLGTLTGFAYLVDQDEAEVQGFRLSSQSYGVRLAGTRAIGPQARLRYQLSWARQSDYHHNPTRYQADYWLADAALDVRGWTLNTGYEVLGADGGRALTSFQTPLGSVFKFQGWADKLTVTPPNGVRDFYAGGGYGWKKLGRIDALSLQAVWHRYQSDRLNQHYGDEWNLLATAKLRKTQLSARYARYEADRFAADTSRFWLQLDWTY
ncbi:alginate export family protein [Sphingomonas sp. 22176]|uniref:alginate export family protein n=1 Tax=Sphingomonas sp. 22176 TaxID=3453884 RepID=UPI003F82CE69